MNHGASKLTPPRSGILTMIDAYILKKTKEKRGEEKERKKKKHTNTLWWIGVFFVDTQCVPCACYEQKVAKENLSFDFSFQEEHGDAWCHGVWLYQWNEIMLWGRI